MVVVRVDDTVAFFSDDDVDMCEKFVAVRNGPYTVVGCVTRWGRKIIPDIYKAFDVDSNKYMGWGVNMYFTSEDHLKRRCTIYLRVKNYGFRVPTNSDLYYAKKMCEEGVDTEYYYADDLYGYRVKASDVLKLIDYIVTKKKWEKFLVL